MMSKEGKKFIVIGQEDYILGKFHNVPIGTLVVCTEDDGTDCCYYDVVGADKEIKGQYISDCDLEEME